MRGRHGPGDPFDGPSIVSVFLDAAMYTIHSRVARLQTGMNWAIGVCARACSAYRASRRRLLELKQILTASTGILSRDRGDFIGALRVVRLLKAVLCGDAEAAELPPNWKIGEDSLPDPAANDLKPGWPVDW